MDSQLIQNYKLSWLSYIARARLNVLCKFTKGTNASWESACPDYYYGSLVVRPSGTSRISMIWWNSFEFSVAYALMPLR
jgi:hypothetical protein